MTNEIIAINWSYTMGGKKPPLPFSAFYVLFEESGEKFIFADSFCEDHKDLIKKHPHLRNVEVLNEGIISFSKQTDFTFSGKTYRFKHRTFVAEKRILKEMFE